MYKAILGVMLILCAFLVASGQQPTCSQTILPLVFVNEREEVPEPAWTAADFSVAVDKLPAKIDELSQGTFPRSTMILLDRSASMGVSGRWKIAQAVAVRLAKESPEGPVHLATFSEHLSTLLDMREALASGKDNVQVFGAHSKDRRTGTYDAILSSARRMPRVGPEDMIVLITDGPDNFSRAHLKDVSAVLRDLQLRLFVVIVESMPPAAWVDHPELLHQSNLAELAKESGGLFLSVVATIGLPHAISNEDMARILAGLSRSYAQVNRSYRLTFSSSPRAKKALIQIKAGQKLRRGMAFYYPRSLAACPAPSPGTR